MIESSQHPKLHFPEDLGKAMILHPLQKAKSFQAAILGKPEVLHASVNKLVEIRSKVQVSPFYGRKHYLH